MDNLPAVIQMPQNKHIPVNDILEWLYLVFGFQVNFQKHILEESSITKNAITRPWFIHFNVQSTTLWCKAAFRIQVFVSNIICADLVEHVFPNPEC